VVGTKGKGEDLSTQKLKKAQSCLLGEKTGPGNTYAKDRSLRNRQFTTSLGRLREKKIKKFPSHPLGAGKKGPSKTKWEGGKRHDRWVVQAMMHSVDLSNTEITGKK